MNWTWTRTSTLRGVYAAMHGSQWNFRQGCPPVTILGMRMRGKEGQLDEEHEFTFRILTRFLKNLRKLNKRDKKVGDFRKLPRLFNKADTAQSRHQTVVDSKPITLHRKPVPCPQAFHSPRKLQPHPPLFSSTPSPPFSSSTSSSSAVSLATSPSRCAENCSGAYSSFCSLLCWRCRFTMR